MKPTLADIIRKAAKMSGYTVDQMKSDCRNQPLARARFAVYKVANIRGYAYARIGRELNKDHTSVRHGALMCGEYTKREPEFAAFVSDLAKWANTPIALPVYVTFHFLNAPPVAKAEPVQVVAMQPYRPKARNVFDNSDPLFAGHMVADLDLVNGSAGLGNVIKEALAA